MKSAEGIEFQRQFFKDRRELLHLTQLLEHLPGAYFFAKDRDSRFVRMNAVNLELYGLTEECSLLGKSDRDFHPPALAEAYIAEDQRVIESQQPIYEQTWLVPYLDGRLQWFVSTKIPLIDSSGETVGIAGVMYAVSTPEEQMSRLKSLAPAIRFFEQHFAEQTQLSEVAKSCGLSLTHFNRMFREILQMSPSQYRTTLRIQRARFLLRNTRESITHIATDTGFCDQSHLTKQFKRMIGMTPAQYRTEFGPSGRHQHPQM